MADILSDLNPIPVVFADGQQPTAKMLNAWANQIDVAFSIVGRILGDVDAESSDRASYITNLIRALGSMGWINPRLPHNLISGAASPPTIVEKLVSGVGNKEAFLTFMPATNGALANISGDFNADGVYGNDWLKVAPGDPNPAINLNAANKYTVSGRRVFTSTPIVVNTKLQYRINPQTTDGYESYAPGSGANVIPSLYEIAAINTPGDSITNLCTLSVSGGNTYISFPYILRAMNPTAPFSTLSADVLNLAHDGGGDVRWSDLAHTPKYTVPVNIMALIDEDNRIPDGLVSLWINRDGHQTQIVNHNSEDQIVFFYDPGFPTRIRIQLPPELVGAMPHDDDITLINQYIVAFAGTSITEALVHERAHALRHRHDGLDDSASIEATSLAERFNATKWFFPVDRFNHFPQYLDRSGYTEGSDTLNHSNALLGSLFLAQSNCTPGSTESPNSSSAASHPIVFGHFLSGPVLKFVGGDNESSLVALDENDGKLVVDRKSLRVNKSIFIGPDDQSVKLYSTVGGTATLFLSHPVIVDSSLAFSSGFFIARANKYQFSSIGNISATGGGADTATTFTFQNHQGHPAKADVKAQNFLGNALLSETEATLYTFISPAELAVADTGDDCNGLISPVNPSTGVIRGESGLHCPGTEINRFGVVRIPILPSAQAYADSDAYSGIKLQNITLKYLVGGLVVDDLIVNIYSGEPHNIALEWSLNPAPGDVPATGGVHSLTLGVDSGQDPLEIDASKPYFLWLKLTSIGGMSVTIESIKLEFSTLFR